MTLKVRNNLSHRGEEVDQATTDDQAAYLSSTHQTRRQDPILQHRSQQRTSPAKTAKSSAKRRVSFARHWNQVPISSAEMSEADQLHEIPEAMLKSGRGIEIQLLTAE